MPHDGYRLERLGHRARAVCTCGWKSQVLNSGGLAGAAWDVHIESTSPSTSQGTSTSLDSSAPEHGRC